MRRSFISRESRESIKSNESIRSNLSIPSNLPIILLAAAAHAGSHTSPPSAAFRVDTRDAAAVRVTGVSSRWCDGAYGGSGRHVYFLAGVPLDVTFTAQVEWGGKSGSRLEFNGANNGLSYTRSLNVGALGAGGKLEVVAVAADGTRSPAFRANFDVAPLPPFADMAFYPQAFTLNSDLSYSIPAFNLGMLPGRSGVVQGCPLPGETMDMSPALNAAAEFAGDGRLTIKAAVGVNNDIKLNGTQSRRPDGKFGKAAGVDFGFDIEGEIVAAWHQYTGAWAVSEGYFGLKFYGKYSTAPYYVYAPPPIYRVRLVTQ